MTGRTRVIVNHEASAWLRQVASELLARLAEARIETKLGGIVVVPIRGSRPGSIEDRTCDRCRAWVPPGDLLYPFSYAPIVGVVLTGGLCSSCVVRESPDALEVTR